MRPALVRNRGSRLPILLVASVLVGGTWAATAGLPYLSESYNHLHVAARFRGPFAALDPALVPLRPLQHAYFQVLAAFDVAPALARFVPFALHLAAVLLVAHLARALGCRGGRAWIPPLLFLAFPSVAGTAWVGAIGGPGRVVCMLAGLACLLRHLERPGFGTGVGIVASLVLGLGFHQSAIVLPVLYALFVAQREAEGGHGLHGAVRRLRSPALLITIALCAAYVVYVAFLRGERHHGVVGAGALVANAVKASLALAPEAIRYPAVEGLRGHTGPGGAVFGAIAVLLAVATFALGLVRGTPAVRALCAGAALDLALPALSTGFVGRYAVLAAALMALALGVAWETARTVRSRRWLGVGAVLLLVAWTVDHVEAVLEVREAGAITAALVTEAARVRAATPEELVVTLVDAPDAWGREADVPVFNWGLVFALERAGARGPWRFYRTYPARTSTDHAPLDPSALESLQDGAEGPILVFDREHRCFVERGPSGTVQRPR